MEADAVSIPLHSPNWREMFFFFCSGLIIGVPLTLFMDQLANNLLIGVTGGFSVLISGVIFAPPIEEFSKIFPLFYRHGETERSIFKLASLTGLGFGVFEFLTYVFALGAPVIGRLPALFFHPASTSISAYGIAKNKISQFFTIAVVLHFASNLLALSSPIISPFSIVAVGVTVALSFFLRSKTREIIIS